MYKKEYIDENGGQERLIIEIVLRKNSQAICSVCGEKHSTYDHKPRPRDFEFVPLLKNQP